MKKLLVVLLVVFVIIQFFRIDQTNPPINKGMDFLVIKNTPESTAQLIKTSCYDCHSNESKYPWYTNIQPLGWFLKDHIEEGRKKLNFSTFATYDVKRQAHKLFEAAHEVETDEMPLESYRLGHADANLTDEEKVILVNYFREVEAETRRSNALPAEEIKIKN